MRTVTRTLAGWMFVSILSGMLPHALAGVNAETRTKLQAELNQRGFTARVNLYDAEIYQSGEIRSEWDAEAIKVGMKIQIDGLSTTSNRIKLRLKHPGKKEWVKVDFVFDRALSPDLSQDREALEKMLAIAFEEKK